MSRRYPYPWLAIAMIALLLFSSCERRLLEDPIQTTALIPISVDWSVSGLDLNDMNAFSVWFYPENGDRPIYKVSNNIHQTEIALPVGTYSIILFNETVNSSDWNNISFRGFDRFETFEAYSRKLSQAPPFYQTKAQEHLSMGCDHLSTWSYRNFRVTEAMIPQSRERKKSLPMKNKEFQQAVAPFQMIKPELVTIMVRVSAHIDNLSTAGKLYGSLKGVTSSFLLASGERNAEPTTHLFEFTERIWKNEKKTDGISIGKVLSFGKIPNEASQYKLGIHPIMYWANKDKETYEFDVTEKIDNKLKIIDIYINNPPLHFPKAEGVYVGDWENEEITIH